MIHKYYIVLTNLQKFWVFILFSIHGHYYKSWEISVSLFAVNNLERTLPTKHSVIRIKLMCSWTSYNSTSWKIFNSNTCVVSQMARGIKCLTHKSCNVNLVQWLTSPGYLAKTLACFRQTGGLCRRQNASTGKRCHEIILLHMIHSLRI